MKAVKRILVTGSEGQVGSKLVGAFIDKYGSSNILSTDLKPKNQVKGDKLYTELDVLKKNELDALVKDFKPNQIVHLAAILSGRGEENPKLAMEINDTGVRNVFDVSVKHGLSVFIPSTIAAFGPYTPKKNTPDVCITNPRTMYGITKIFMELLGTYYNKKFGLDFRSVRYPGVISADPPGRGTTDCIIELFYSAAAKKQYACFLTEHTELPMMHIDDLVDGTIKLIETEDSLLTDRVYNMGGFSVTPRQTTDAIKKVIPNFNPTYVPDFRQAIADSWPGSINYAAAARDWNYSPKYKKIDDMVVPLLKEIEAEHLHHI